MSVMIDAANLDYKALNADLRNKINDGADNLEIQNVCGQRYIGDALNSSVHLHIHGTPGQNLGAFMRGPLIDVDGNAQDGTGNTMDAGEIRINGHAGDVLGYAMRGGHIFIKEDVGYRVGIHMKAYKEHFPVIVIGGKAGAFLGEYMAGGIIIVLGMQSQYPRAPLAGRYLGTGMHGGRIFIRGKISSPLLGKGLIIEDISSEDRDLLEKKVQLYADAFGQNAAEILDFPFTCIRPASDRPYGNLYVGAN